MSSKHQFIAKANLGLWTTISQLSTTILLGGQGQLLKVHIYTVKFEQWIRFLANVWMCLYSFLTVYVKILSKFYGIGKDHMEMAVFLLLQAATNIGNDSTVSHQSQQQYEMEQWLVGCFFVTMN
jgi:hypothetical protein